MCKNIFPFILYYLFNVYTIIALHKLCDISKCVSFLYETKNVKANITLFMFNIYNFS